MLCMAGYPSENAWVSEVKCNKIIENKRNKTKKKKLINRNVVFPGKRRKSSQELWVKYEAILNE